MSRLGSTRSPRPIRAFDVAVEAVVLGVPLGVATCVLLGLGLQTGASTSLALTAALAVALLPVVGLASGFRAIGAGSSDAGRRVARVLSAWIWTIALLLTVPGFAPGERREAARRGADVLFAAHLGPLREPAGSFVGTLASWLGAEGEKPPEPLAIATPQAATSPSASKPQPDETAPRPSTRTPVARPDPAPTAPVVLAYRGDGRELDVEVALDGPDFGDRFRMIFDTGASFTTVTPDALAEIDVDVPRNAPRVTLNTAGGPIDAPLVLLDAVWLGDAPVEWVTVAACPSCTAPGRSGLLGLNVSSQFRVEIDHDRKRIHLDPSPGDRRHDIRPWLDLKARGVNHGGERLEFDVTIGNRAPRAVATATIEIDCGETGAAVDVADIPAEGERTTSLTLPGPTDCPTFRLGLLSATWHLDRF